MAGWLSLIKPPKAECQIATYWTSAPSPPFCSLLCDAGVGTFASSFLSLSPKPEAFYWILPIGGARGQLKGEKRSASSIPDFMPSWAPASTGCWLSLLTLLAFPEAASASLRGSSANWLAPFLSALSASSTGLLSELPGPSNPISQGDSYFLQLGDLSVSLHFFGALVPMW